MKKLILLLGLCFFTSLASAATLYDKLAQNFDSGLAPTAKDLDGYWAGRCAEPADPNRQLPAVFVYRKVTVEGDFPPTRQSFTYFRHDSKAADSYDRYAPRDVERDTDIRAWLDREQWQAVQATGGAMVTHYAMSDSIRIERAVRLYDDEFNKLLILRVTRETATASTISRYCYFHKFLGKADTVIPSEPFFGSTGPVSYRWVSLQNPLPFTPLIALEFRNGAGSVWVERPEILMSSGIVVFGGDFALPTGVKAGMALIPQQMFRARSLTFYVRGRTSGIEVRGLTARGEAWRTTLK